LAGSVGSGAGTALVRPESITVTADPDGEALVSSVAFLGPILRVYVALPDGQVLHAQVTSSAAEAFSPGDPVSVGVQPAPVLVI
jgi:putative spermidine/putrescine transport system ATP-binding protein